MSRTCILKHLHVTAAAVSVIVLLGACGVGATSKVSSKGGSTTTSPTISTSGSTAIPSPPATTGTTAPAPPPIGAGQQAGASSVPWPSVGQGWILAADATSDFSAANPPTTLYLVDPAGGRYDLGSSPLGYLDDWSGDGTHALFVGSSPQSASSVTVYVEDLQTGLVDSTTVPAGYVNGVQFTKPDGTAIVDAGVLDTTAQPVPPTRLTFSGTVQQTYPSSYPQAGKVFSNFAESSDGTQLVFQTANGFEVVSNSGQAVRFIPPPAGQTECGVQRWWGGGQFLEDCQSGNEYLQPIQGGTPTTILSLGNSQVSDVIDVWPLPSGNYAQGVACGTAWIDKINGTSSLTHLNPPGVSAGESVTGVGADGSKLVVTVTGGCGDGQTSTTPTGMLEWFDPVANTLTPLVGTSTPTGGVVRQAILFRDGVTS